MHPRLLVRRTLCGVIAINGIQRSDLEPASQQISRRRTGKTSNVVTDERVTRNPHAQEHRRAHLQMIPGAAVVARPSGGIPLGAGIRGAREHEWPFVRLEFAQPVVRGADILHAVHIVDGAMIECGSIVQPMHGVKRHGFIAT